MQNALAGPTGAAIRPNHYSQGTNDGCNDRTVPIEPQVQGPEPGHPATDRTEGEAPQ